MTILSAQKIEQISRGNDPKLAILKAVGDISKEEVLTDLVLLGTFIRNEKYTANGASGKLIIPLDVLKEDEFQGKVGLVLKKGPLAFGDWEEGTARGDNARLHTWVVYAVKDAWPIQVNGVACRVVPYDKLRLRVSDPTVVF